ncbi:MAG: nucleoside triphosphate pyrophosphohydrolase family protein [Actinomycetota bacterium]|nr:nucleoside triphosphate pyrophosphohydrolase family protein [Actinomycetota bacterium]
MKLSDYQRQAQGTDRVPVTGDDDRDRVARLVPLLGLAGEVGTLLAGYKKYLRDGDAYELFVDNVGEEVGDLLWYLANVAEKWGLSLDDLAADNLVKTTDRWRGPGGRNARRRASEFLDHGCPPSQRLPRTFAVDIRPVGRDRGPEERIEVHYRGHKVGDRLGDNTYDDSGYRFHDVFHLANAAILGWSPVARAKVFDRKRRMDDLVDAVEDGGRAIVIEEGMVAFLFEHARNHRWFCDVTDVDYAVLKTVRVMTAELEVKHRPLWEVERAILQGFTVWRMVREAKGGTVTGDLYRRSLEFRPLT